MSFTVRAVTRRAIVQEDRRASEILFLLNGLNVLATYSITTMSVRKAVLLTRVMRTLIINDPCQITILTLRNDGLLVLSIIRRPSVSNSEEDVILTPYVLVALLIIVRRLAILISTSILR